jgi:hypothetical protein
MWSPWFGMMGFGPLPGPVMRAEQGGCQGRGLGRGGLY